VETTVSSLCAAKRISTTEAICSFTESFIIENIISRCKESTVANVPPVVVSGCNVNAGSCSECLAIRTDGLHCLYFPSSKTIINGAEVTLGSRCFQDGHVEPYYQNAERYSTSDRCAAPTTSTPTDSTATIEQQRADTTLNEGDLTRAAAEETTRAATTDISALSNCAVLILAISPSSFDDASRRLSVRFFVQIYCSSGELIDAAKIDAARTLLKRLFALLMNVPESYWADISIGSTSAKRAILQNGNGTVFEGNITSNPVNTTVSTSGSTSSMSTTMAATTAAATTMTATTAAATTMSATTGRGSSGNLLVPSLLLFLGLFYLLFMVKA